MERTINPHAYARKLLGFTEKRAAGETMAIPVTELRALCTAVLEGKAEPKPDLPKAPSGPLPSARDTVLSMLDAAGSMFMNDIQSAIGKDAKTTKGIITKLVKDKKITFNEKTMEVKIKADNIAA